MRTQARVGFRGRGVGLPGTQRGLPLVGFVVMETHCLCNTDILCLVDYFIHLGIGCLVSIFFLLFFLVSGVRFCACGFVQHNRDWAAEKPCCSLLRVLWRTFFRGLIYGVHHFDELSEVFF
jgi:hypothetical protein